MPRATVNAQAGQEAGRFNRTPAKGTLAFARRMAGGGAYNVTNFSQCK
jgi:hypothetical protein